MKRSVPAAGEELNKKKSKVEESGSRSGKLAEAEAVLSDDNLLFEVLKSVGARTLASAACVSRQWRKAAHDERIWELICTEHYSRSPQQLRAVVLALGGFRRLYTLCLWPLLKPSASSSSTSSPRPSFAWPFLPPVLPVPARPPGGGMKTRWGKDEVNLSLSLLSIRYYEKMNFNNRGK